MSLLMEALRRAEEQKRQGQGDGEGGRALAALEPSPASTAFASSEMQTPQAAAGASRELQLEPIAVPTECSEAKLASSADPEPRVVDFPQRLAELDEQFLAHAAQARAPSSSPRRTDEGRTMAPPTASAAPAAPPPPTMQPTAEPTTGTAPKAARLMFEVKRSAPRRSVVSIAAGIGLIAALAIGAYYGWQWQTAAGGAHRWIASSPASHPPTSVAPPVGPSVVERSSTPMPVLASAPSPPALPLDEEEELARDEPDEPRQPAARRGSSRSVATAARPQTRSRGESPPPVQAALPSPSTLASPAAAAPPRLQITPATSADDPARQAHEAYLRGDYERAETLWRALLQADSRQREALHGLAVLALRQQQPALAADYYRRALEADPRDAPALAGLLALRGQADPRLAESRLKSRLAEQPDSPHLNFALGNLLAQEGRWAEAQQAYFNAHAADPGNPDILFNLAVSLDHLRQFALAVRYYRQALAAAASQPVGFERQEVEARLKQLAGEER